jgi:nicotinate phosphoribosyltransferase
MFKECTGHLEAGGRFVNTADHLEIEAVLDGEKVKPWETVMRVRGRYRDFAFLETPTLGAMARRTRIATNVYRTLEAARGKPVFFFPARFDIHEAQPGDGHAYSIAIERFNMDYNKSVHPFISTTAQGDWWGERGGGTVAHAYILCFLRDTAEAMLQFAQYASPEVKRIALVDSNNDCVSDSVAAASALFRRYKELMEAGRAEEAKKFILYGVRADTAGNMIDKSVEPTGNPREDYGVVPRLIWKMRRALDSLADSMDLSPEWREKGREYFRGIKIVVSGGFDPERIAWFESSGVPVDAYGVGSYLVRGESNEFTADVVRVKVGGQWHDLAKEGRQAKDNPAMKRVE